MIVTRTPLRINFAAGGSDLPAYYRHAPGAVIGTTITVYIYVCVKPNFEGRVMAHYRATENVTTAADLRHDRMRACLQYFGIDRAIEIASLSDVPGSTGLGSSGAFTVGLLLALDRYTGGHEQFEHDSLKLAQTAYQIELEGCGASVGKQDQLFAAIGGARLLQFHADESVNIVDVAVPPQLLDYLFLLDTGHTRDATTILAQQSAAMDDQAKRGHVRAMVDLAYGFRQSLEAGQLWDCGHILHDAWERKRSISAGISTPTIDAYYALARDAGAWGGKLCGAGGGGFMLVMAPPDRHEAVIQATGLRPLPFGFDYEGTRVIYASV